MRTIATIHSCYPEKFGIPRQSGMVRSATAQIIFESEFRNPDAIRGLEGFSHLWLIWIFSKNIRPNNATDWSPTVRPPRLGGNTRMGVFATRSSFRPNPIGLSAVALDRIEIHPDKGPILHVSGIDLMDGTPLLDIKPYLPFSDSIPDARGGFTNATLTHHLKVCVNEDCRNILPSDQMETLIHTLELDPRPSYQDDPNRLYGFLFANWNIHFRVDGDLLQITSILPQS
ncbi:MAG: tRNA (N6-threonylcarbamoyladenosine(37)-N6)-methyltransferase TrmO [Akkermansia sp.]